MEFAAIDCSSISKIFCEVHENNGDSRKIVEFPGKIHEFP
jgi:hypothetical protein